MAQRFIRGVKRLARIQRLRRAVIDVAGLVLFSQLDIKVRQLGLRGGVFRIEFQYFLEDLGRAGIVAGLQELVGDLHILGARVVEEALLSVKLRQFGQAIGGAGIEFGELPVNGNGFDGKAILRILVADFLEVSTGLVILADTGVEVADGVQDREVLGVLFDDLFVFGNGVGKFALLDIQPRLVPLPC